MIVPPILALLVGAVGNTGGDDVPLLPLCKRAAEHLNCPAQGIILSRAPEPSPWFGIAKNIAVFVEIAKIVVFRAKFDVVLLVLLVAWLR